VQIPVSADIEAGYGPSAQDVAETIRGAIKAGAVAVNLEDNARDPGTPLYSIEAQSERIAAARAEAAQAGFPFIINVRTDTYLVRTGEKAEILRETIDRAKAYRQAGADSIFVPFVIDPETIQALVKDIPGPLNIVIAPGSPPIPQLFAWGVQRISIGSIATLATMGLVRDIAHELRETGTYETLTQHLMSDAQANALFAAH